MRDSIDTGSVVGVASTDRAQLDEHRDLQLLQAVIRRDRAAFDELYRRYYSKLMEFLSRMVVRRDVAEEIVNDAMYVVWTGGSSFAGRSKVSTWIFGIAYKKALKRLERDGYTVNESIEEQPETFFEPEFDRELDAMQMKREIDAALTRLSPAHRSVVELTYLLDYSYPEIAEIVGCPVNTVKTRMFHARAQLRRLLGAVKARFA
ncbi:MAG: sigma-70 family RNA polymerase sigma factor [Gammaproteobacteria bacterium]|nr:sigma-70 family RNA polymerase sigma factor [Gammaproteobacteria bacterium]